ncbi:MAG: hypothetical protein NC111_07275 [Bacteroides sp.]|nr:hypothetical protein [Bacteroides sp.]MCM1413996.1 hypothetical protein [Bacteroides sp.]MCM1472309.1 hypothetical protein [Bacteroides sp.]
MNSLHFFNPENDHALALGRSSYTPPRGALAIRRAGQALPLWWAKKGDEVLIDDDSSLHEVEAVKNRFGLDGDIVVRPSSPLLRPDPWGWSHYTRRLFLDAGIGHDMLPSDQMLDRLRELSHRRTASALLERLDIDPFFMPLTTSSVNEALDAVDRWGEGVVKLPWSSSGRGVIYSNASPRAVFASYVEGMIRRQGNVVVEPFYHRTKDFAMLFEIHDSVARFHGLSTFISDGRGFYGGNIVASQDEIRSMIGLDTAPWIGKIKSVLEAIVPNFYSGWIGVDMLVGRFSPCGETVDRIIPAIEINFRRTMGVAAMAIADKLQPQEPMILRVDPSGIVLRAWQRV